MSRININRILIEKGSDRVKVLRDEILKTLNSIDNSTNPSGYITNVALADYSKTADNVTNATKATQDASDNIITATYATKAELPKTTIRV